MDKKINDIMSVLDNIEYGFKDELGNNLINDENKWDKEFNQFYYLLSPSELLEKKCGVCWDQVELERDLFLKNNIKADTYFIYLDDGNIKPSHTFLVYQDQNSYCWFEHAWGDLKGIRKYPSFKALINDLKEKFINSNKEYINKNYPLYLYKYDKPKYHLNCDEFYEFINNSEKIDV